MTGRLLCILWWAGSFEDVALSGSSESGISFAPVAMSTVGTLWSLIAILLRFKYAPNLSLGSWLVVACISKPVLVD